MVQGVTIVDNHIVNVNPATGEEISRVRCSTSTEILAIVDKAIVAQRTWSMLPVKERIQLLRDGLQAISKRTDELVELIVQEMGKPIEQAKTEMRGALNKNEYFDVLEDSLKPIKHGDCNIVIRQPIGVVAVLSPWNFPCDEILLLALPALGSGNTVIVKPSEVAPATGALTVETLARALPDGVVQLAQGDGAVGAQLVAHPAINMIAMTGSSATGKKILESAAPAMKRLVLELGGKDPMIVLDDCDMKNAARDAVTYSLTNAGQVCCSIERIFVAESIYDKFLQAVKQEAGAYKVGNGMDPTVSVGPLVSQLQRDIVRDQVDEAITKGAKIIYQSDAPSDGGSYYPVTVLADVKDDMKIYRDETFGPVVCVSKFDGSESQAVKLANDTVYGLASAVYTTDLEKATRIGQHIEAGQVGINCYVLDHLSAACPWVGHKQSGYGFHSGYEGFRNFSVPKTLVYSANDGTGHIEAAIDKSFQA